MTSRNKSQGRYAGRFRGQHCRTHNVVGKKYKQEAPYCMHRLIPLPDSGVAEQLVHYKMLMNLLRDVDWSDEF